MSTIRLTSRRFRFRLRLAMDILLHEGLQFFFSSCFFFEREISFEIYFSKMILPATNALHY